MLCKFQHRALVRCNNYAGWGLTSPAREKICYQPTPMLGFTIIISKPLEKSKILEQTSRERHTLFKILRFPRWESTKTHYVIFELFLNRDKCLTKSANQRAVFLLTSRPMVFPASGGNIPCR